MIDKWMFLFHDFGFFFIVQFSNEERPMKWSVLKKREK